MTRAERIAAFRRLLGERMLVLDRAMGTMIPSHNLREADYRGTCGRDWPSNLKGNNDLPTLTRPHLIRDARARFPGDVVVANANRQASAALATA